MGAADDTADGDHGEGKRIYDRPGRYEHRVLASSAENQR